MPFASSKAAWPLQTYSCGYVNEVNQGWQGENELASNQLEGIGLSFKYTLQWTAQLGAHGSENVNHFLHNQYDQYFSECKVLLVT